MATVKIRIFVDELTNVLVVPYDRIKVYRATTEDGSYVEITDAGTRPQLVAGTTIYEYIDTTAVSSSLWYKTSYYHSVDTTESSLSDAIQGIDAGLYCTLQNIRDEGVSETDLSDERALSLSQGWQDWLVDACGQWFHSREITMDFDGDGTRLLQLPIPIITCTELYINDNFTDALNTDYYAVYNRNNPGQDDRDNPRIKLKRAEATSIFTFTNSTVFEVGDMNQRVVGEWGYVNEDGSTPFAVTRAILILVNLSAALLSDSDIDVFKVGKIVEEVTDRHRVRYSDLFYRLQAWNPTGIMEVDHVIRKYRSPMRVDAPRTMPWNRLTV